MKPTYENLVAAKGGKIAVDIKTANIGGSGLATLRSGAVLGGAGQALTLGLGDGGEGMWVHYLETRACVGVATSGETWAASGPFSGCQIVVGKNGGSVYVAHLAQQSGSTADADWAARGWKDEVWGRWKVPLPSDTFFSSSIVFVDWSKGSSPSQISVVRVDIKTKSMGGFDSTPMEIFNVLHIVNPG